MDMEKYAMDFLVSRTLQCAGMAAATSAIVGKSFLFRTRALPFRPLNPAGASSLVSSLP